MNKGKKSSRVTMLKLCVRICSSFLLRDSWMVTIFFLNLILISSNSVQTHLVNKIFSSFIVFYSKFSKIKQFQYY